MKQVWKDPAGNCRCESCGCIVPRKQLCWDGELGYCQECYAEIQEYRRNPEACETKCSDAPQEHENLSAKDPHVFPRNTSSDIYYRG